jgi:hypothetical protein
MARAWTRDSGVRASSVQAPSHVRARRFEPDGRIVPALPLTASPLPGSAASDINDSMGIHKVANPTNARAVSLHVYAPGWKRAPLFEEMRFEEKFPEVDAGGAELEIDSWGDF